MTESAGSAAKTKAPNRKTEAPPGAFNAAEAPIVGAAHPPLSADDIRAVEHLVTEDDTPVPNRFSEKQRRLLTSSLYDSWDGPGRGRPFMVCANVGIFLHPREDPLVPDVFLSLDVEEIQDPWTKEGRSYFIWVYKKAPDVVIEVVSHQKRDEMAATFTRYARFGVPFYVSYDPLRLVQEEPVQVWQLTSGGAYSPCAYDSLPGTGLGLRLWRGRFENLEATWLRWHDAPGELVLTGTEVAAQARDKANQARDRADRLEALLRTHGISPDGGIKE